MNKRSMPAKEQKFKQLVEENSGRISRICHYYALSAEDRKDMYQEILINIWKSLDSFRGDAAISTWIYRIAVNTSLSFKGKELQRLSVTVNRDFERLYRLLSDEEDPGVREREARLDEMETVLNQLCVVDKLLISLVLEELSTREIADIVGITETNVRVKIHRIKQSLQQHFKGKDHE